MYLGCSIYNQGITFTHGIVEAMHTSPAIPFYRHDSSYEVTIAI